MPLAMAPLEPVIEWPDFRGLMVFAVLGVAALWTLFLVLILVRYWMQRSAKRSGRTGELNLERLRQERDAGRLTQEEYEAVRNRLAGASAPSTLSRGVLSEPKGGPVAGGKGGRAGGPIREKGASDGADAGSESDGTR